jgi:hypothetical protein
MVLFDFPAFRCSIEVVMAMPPSSVSKPTASSGHRFVSIMLIPSGQAGEVALMNRAIQVNGDLGLGRAALYGDCESVSTKLVEVNRPARNERTSVIAKQIESV